VSTELFSLAAPGILINSFDISPSGDDMWISDAKGGLSHVDQREGGKAARRQLNDKEKIGCVSVNKQQPHLLLTSSNDRFVKCAPSAHSVAARRILNMLLLVGFGMQGSCR
jgi:hypothetical protein